MWGEKRMFDVENVYGLDKDLEKVNLHIERLLKAKNSMMQEVMDWILAAKGKQIRPILTLLCARFGNRELDVTEYAAIIEICHMASLVHDDIIDEADYRRGQLSVQKKFGQKLAVYAGDYRIFSVIGHTNCRLSNRHKKIYRMLEQLCEGELGQTSNLYNMDITIEKYLDNIGGKTATMFELACNIGAMESKCSKKIIQNLSSYGKNLGMMFQIRDDLIDFSSNLQKEGKPVCQDFANGVYTLPIIIACKNEEYKKQLEQLAKYYKTKQKEKVVIDSEILGILDRSKAFEVCDQYMKDYYKKALEALVDLPDCIEKQTLVSLARKVRG